MLAPNPPASLLYSKLSAGLGGLILGAPLFGIPESEWVKATGIVLAASGCLAMVMWKIVSWGSALFLARVTIINGLPEKLAEYEARAIERDKVWAERLKEWEARFNATDTKLDAFMELQKTIVESLTKQIDGVAGFQRREARKLFEVERWLREGRGPGIIKRRERPRTEEDSDDDSD